MNEKNKDLGCVQRKIKIRHQQMDWSELWIGIEYFFVTFLKNRDTHPKLDSKDSTDSVPIH